MHTNVIYKFGTIIPFISIKFVVKCRKGMDGVYV